MTTAAVILAAGESRRFGETSKLLAPFRGRPLYEWPLHTALHAGLDATYVVVGPVPLSVPDEVTIVPNPRWALGQATSLDAAVEVGRRDGHERLVVGLADQPLVRASAWCAVAAAQAPIAVATYSGRRSHPVGLDADVWPLLPTEGDAGARVVMRERPDLVMGIPCDGNPADVDTEDDLRRLEHAALRDARGTDTGPCCLPSERT